MADYDQSGGGYKKFKRKRPANFGGPIGGSKIAQALARATARPGVRTARIVEGKVKYRKIGHLRRF